MIQGQLTGIDKREFPRIDVELPLSVGKGGKGKAVNISDGGLCFSGGWPDSVKEGSLTLNFPSKDVTLPVQIKWKSEQTDNDVLYGAEIIKADKDALTIMRKYMVEKQFKAVVKDVSDRWVRREILSFAKHTRDYLFELSDLNIALGAGRIEKDTLQEKITQLNSDIVTRGEDLKNNICDEKLMNNIKDIFRTLVSCWAYKSKIMYRGFEKPKGYPGDYETLEVIYDRRTFSPDNELGYYFDVYFLRNNYAEAVRRRKDKLKEMLDEIILESKGPVSILNLACGGSKEVRDICEEKKKDVINKEVVFNCLDWDDEALKFSEEQLKDAPANFHIKFIKENILSFIRRTAFYEREGKQDIIYSIGLADYFTDRILKVMIKNAFSGLKKNGKFIIAHKDKDISFSHLPPEWFCDWVFYQRNERDLMNIVRDADLENCEIKKDRDVTNNIFFFTLIKK